MTINWKIWAPIGIVVIAAFTIIGFYQSGTKTSEAPIIQKTPQVSVTKEEQKEQPVARPATGNVDDAVDGILAGISDDQALFADAEKDAKLITADSQAISNFDQSYNENEF